MPLIIPKDLISQETLEKENIFIMDENRAGTQDIRPLKIAIVNLMPKKEETELQLIRMLSNTALQINIDLIRMKTHNPKNTSIKHLERFYKTFDEVKDSKYDAMIVTGAPVELLQYEKIKYWSELKEIFDYAKENVFSTMFICWSAQAAIFHYYGVDCQVADEKVFGVFEFDKLQEDKLFKGFDDTFSLPTSRHTLVREEDLADIKDLKILASRPDTGVGIATTHDNRFVFNFGHFEYEKDTLHKEYLRDISKNRKISIPKDYYVEDDYKKGIKLRWRSVGNLFFSNWINYCVYQETPYEIEEIKVKNVSKFGGSSLSDHIQFSKVKDIISKNDDRDIIVVSAPGKRNTRDTKVTDKLIEIHENKKNIRDIEDIIERLKIELEGSKDMLSRNITEVKGRFEDIAVNLKLEDGFLTEINSVFKDIEQSDSRDFIISRGEYLNARIMAKYLGYKFIDAKDVIVFDKNKEVDLKESYKRINEHFKEKEKVVIPGFYGADLYGNIIIFDRGGSDYTGSIIAGALNADVYENWTDVNGVMDSDPKKNENSKTYKNLSYNELSKIIQSGAEVYQLDAIKPVRDKNITIKILNTNDPENEGTSVRD